MNPDATSGYSMSREAPSARPLSAPVHARSARTGPRPAPIHARSARTGLGLVLLAAILVAAACSTSVGDAGPLGSAPPVATTVPATSGTPASGGPVMSGAGTPTPEATGSAAPAGGATPGPSGRSADTSVVQAYFLSGEMLVPVAREVPWTVAVARAAMTELLAGPSAAEAASPLALLTVVPAGTQLLGVTITNGVATVDLTGDFASGGGSASMFARLAQVVYTLTQFPTVNGVVFRIDGQPVTTFSSEGILLEGPSVRADYQGNLPPIFLDRPAWGARLANPARVTGLANVFEAQFLVEIATAEGAVLASRQVMASCGSGCWGTYDVSIPYSVDREEPGTVTVYDLSARDGSRENVRSYPVVLEPAG